MRITNRPIKEGDSPDLSGFFQTEDGELVHRNQKDFYEKMLHINQETKQPLEELLPEQVLEKLWEMKRGSSLKDNTQRREYQDANGEARPTHLGEWFDPEAERAVKALAERLG